MRNLGGSKLALGLIALIAQCHLLEQCSIPSMLDLVMGQVVG